MSTFKKGSMTEKMIILKFLKDQKLENICFEFKNNVINFLNKRNIDVTSVFPKNDFKALGKADKVSTDAMIYIIHKGDAIHIPVEYIEDITLAK